MKKIAITLSIATLLASSFALHADSERFARWDKDSDGKVSVEEFTAKGKNKEKAIKRFERLDSDKDGYLSEAEAAAMPARNKGKNKGKNKDKNKDK